MGQSPTDTAFSFLELFLLRLLWSKEKAAKCAGLIRDNGGRFVKRPYGVRKYAYGRGRRPRRPAQRLNVTGIKCFSVGLKHFTTLACRCSLYCIANREEQDNAIAFVSAGSGQLPSKRAALLD